MPTKSRSQTAAAALTEPAHAVVEDLKNLARDSGHALTRAGEHAGEKVVAFRKRMQGTLKRTRSGYDDLRSSAMDQLERCSDLVKANPLRAVGVAVVVGAALGILLWPRRRR